MMKQLDERQLATILRKEFESADSYSEHLFKLQRLAERAYEADESLIPITEGRSRVMLPDVQEAHDYMHASILRTFVSGDRTIEFEPADDGDEDATDEATAAIDYNFMRQQDGYRLLSDMCHDGLLRKIGVIKAVAEDEEKVTRETIQADPLQLAMLPDGYEIEDYQEQPDGTLIAQVKRTEVKRVFRDYIVPPSQIRFSPNARHENDADYIGDVEEKTRSELIEMGFDREQVMGLPKNSRFEDWTRHNETSEQGRYQFNDEASSPALERVQLHEEYALIDVDGDGIAERVKVFRVENAILRNQGEPAVDEMGQPVTDEDGEPVYEEGELAIETVEEHPYSIFTPFPKPHTIIGYSLSDKVMDLMIQRSFIARQLFDGMALSNMPRFYVDETQVGDSTYSDILTPIPGSPIRGNGPNAVREISQSFDASKSLQVMEWLTGERETRTGITRLNQGLDADTLNKTATGAALMQAQGQQQEEYIARNFAEAFARHCMKKYRMMRRESEPFTIRVDGQPRLVTPSEWPEAVHVRVRVGLGTNSKDKRLQARFALLQPLQYAMEGGLASHEHAFNWADGVMRDSGIGQGEDMMFDPNDPEFQAQQQAQPEQPDPAVMEVQAKMQLQREEAEHKAQLREFEAQRKLDLEAAKASGQFDLAVFKAETEAELGAYKARMEVRRKVNVTDQRMGGSLAS